MKKIILLLTGVISLSLGFSVHAADLVQSETTNVGPEYSIAPNSVSNIPGSYYDWGRAQNGFGYCYEWTYNGQVLNGGAAQPDFYCEQRSPSFFNWGRANNGYGYCYQYTGNGLLMNMGTAQSNYSCERYQPSHYAWGRGQDGYTRCYQYTPQSLAMNAGAPVSNFYCQ